MTGTASRQMAELAESIETSLVGSTTSVTGFPSGGAMLDVRRDDGRTFVMAYTPVRGFGVDEIRADEGFVTSYRFTYVDFDPAAERLRQLIGVSEPNGDIASEIELNLVVLYAHDLESARQFYAMLGCRFQTEKHGSGPAHYSAVLGRTVFELYPCNHRPAGRTRIGFRVRSMDQTLESLRARDAKVLSAPQASEWGRRAIVEDPMGNPVELTESVET